MRKEIPSDWVLETDDLIVFKDINPQAPTHVLIIPRKEIASLSDLDESDEELVGHLFAVTVRLADQLGLRNGYRTVINCGSDGGQTVDHLHIHLLGGRAMSWPPG